MAYCTTAELAQALRITENAATTPVLQRCIDAAALEIDAALDRTDPVPAEATPLLASDNVFRGVQWYKANDIALGGGGTPDSGLLVAPTEAYVPKAVVPYKQNWGVA
jgi:hypothetical protein